MAAPVERRTRIVDVDTVECGREPVRVALSADLTIGDDVQAGEFLVADRQPGRVTLGLVQVLRRNPPQFAGGYPRWEPVSEPFPVD